MSKLDPGMSRDQVIEAAKGKLEEARFFISKMHETETRQHLGADERQFGWFLSAFLSAARSAPQVISALEYSLKGKDKDWIWINEVRNGWDDSQRELYREMTDLRNLAVHWGTGRADSAIEFVSHWELPHERGPLDGYVFISQAPGVPAPKIGVRKFSIKIGSLSVPAVKCAGQYLELVSELVHHFAK